jgi:hypothetical protein
VADKERGPLAPFITAGPTQYLLAKIKKERRGGVPCAGKAASFFVSGRPRRGGLAFSGQSEAFSAMSHRYTPVTPVFLLAQ